MYKDSPATSRTKVTPATATASPIFESLFVSATASFIMIFGTIVAGSNDATCSNSVAARVGAIVVETLVKVAAVVGEAVLSTINVADSVLGSIIVGDSSTAIVIEQTFKSDTSRPTELKANVNKVMEAVSVRVFFTETDVEEDNPDTTTFKVTLLRLREWTKEDPQRSRRLVYIVTVI
mmetsp:Transcript_11261/g.14662  ORF Transcript_11261/g.14662 Transcript_11261/m.14662 type:complete len:178 (+) Transcript_11261:181-714(+)